MVHKYFQDYATHFNLWTYIRFNTRVKRLYNLGNDTSGLQEWIIESKDGKEGYHHVCVGNGHYEDGWIPDIPGLSYVLVLYHPFLLAIPLSSHPLDSLVCLK
jgi:cation diffusion facilitator CzcD-associated flavoprotein CzcO